jgi:alcohol dehydrogenase class IV
MKHFLWVDGERVVRFGRGVAAEAVATLGGPGFRLLTTPRAEAAVPSLRAAAAATHHVERGAVPELAAAALDWARGAGGDDRIVALGGGRVVDVAKAVAAGLGGGARAMAVPTTLSGAELTTRHRHAAGVPERTPHVRCAVVVHDPALVASQPLGELAASACNALGHAVEAPCTTRANPVSTLAALDAAQRLVRAFAIPLEPDRDALALGALLAGYALDSTGLGLHHVVAQSLVPLGVGHGQANAIMLPHTIGALARRAPERHAELAVGLGEDPAAAAARLCGLTHATRLRELGLGEAELDRAADAAASRAQLDATPPRADREELRALYAAAY